MRREARGGEPLSCFHCGLPVATGAAFGGRRDDGLRAFCCAGCEAVSRFIGASGLEDYYRLRQAPPGAAAAAGATDAQLALYDDATVQSRFVRDAGQGVREAELILEGAHCAACAWLIERLVARVPGVASVVANYSTRRVNVRWREGTVRLSAIFAAIRDAGYTAWPHEGGSLALVAARERRDLLRRLLIAGLGMMQVMMYAVPAYIAGDGDIGADAASLMRWAGLLLTVPVIFYSAAPFFRGARRDLRVGVPGMDVPIAIGLGVAFAASAFNTWRGAGDVYFDSVAMFVFLVLGARYFELAARERAGLALQRLAGLAPAGAWRLLDATGMRTEHVAAALLKPGERVLVRAGETVPADGVLASEEALVSEALLSGESRLLARRRGQRIVGASVNAGPAFIVLVTHVGADTTLSAIRRMMQSALAHRPRWVALAERAARGFVIGILACAAAAAAAWLAIDPARAPWVAVSVLIVTCPCALALATPLAMTAATGTMGRGNVVVANGRAIEALAAASDFVFDKTGTLTQGRPRLLETRVLGALDARAALAIAASLARFSSHPLDRAFTLAAPREDLPAVQFHRPHSGLGVEATVGSRRVRLGRADFAAGLHREPAPLAAPGDPDTLVWLADETGWIAVFRIGDTLRADAKAAIEALHALGIRTHLLSGDERDVVASTARRLGIAHAEARATPSGKLAYVQRLQARGARVAMVGDGINDAPVLGCSDVSIAMGGGADLAQVRADAVLVSDSLADLAEAVRLARRARAVIRENLAWALAYNAVVLPLAFAGLVTPLAAAIGMSASSLAVVGNAMRLRR